MCQSSGEKKAQLGPARSLDGPPRTLLWRLGHAKGKIKHHSYLGSGLAATSPQDVYRAEWWGEKNQSWFTPHDINTYYEATIIRIRFHLGKDPQTDQLNGRKSTEIYPYIYILLIFDKGIMNFQWQNWVTKPDKMSLSCRFTLHIKFNSR